MPSFDAVFIPKNTSRKELFVYKFIKILFTLLCISLYLLSLQFYLNLGILYVALSSISLILTVSIGQHLLLNFLIKYKKKQENHESLNDELI